MIFPLNASEVAFSQPPSNGSWNSVTYSKGAYLHHSASKHVSKNKLSFQMNTFSQRLSEIIYGALIKKQANYYRVFISLASSRIYCPLSDIR